MTTANTPRLRAALSGRDHLRAVREKSNRVGPTAVKSPGRSPLNEPERLRLRRNQSPTGMAGRTRAAAA
jgi:hypothetical protein